MINLSIIIITYQRIELLRKCLDSLTPQWPSHCQLIVVVNGVDADSSDYLRQSPLAPQLIELAKGIAPAEARNRALELAKGDMVLFLDDDVELPSHYIHTGLDFLLQHPQIDVLGGPDASCTRGPFLELLMGQALRSPLMTAHTRFRHKPKAQAGFCSEESLILCALWFRRHIFDQLNFKFDSRFFRNEENVLLYQLKHAGKSLYYLPSLEVIHHKRTSLSQLMRGVFYSGHFRAKSLALGFSDKSLLFFTPVSALIIFLLTAIFSAQHALYLLLIYATVTLLAALRVSQSRLLLGIWIIHPLIHLSYALGFAHFAVKSVNYYRSHFWRKFRHFLFT